MSSFNEMMQRFVDSSYEDLLSLAKQALVNLIPKFKLVDKENEGLAMATAVILGAVAADGVLTSLERRFLRELLNLDDQNVDKMVSLYNGREPELIDKFADAMDDDCKANVVMLVTTFAAVDEKISREETALIRKILD